MTTLSETSRYDGFYAYRNINSHLQPA